VLAAVQPAAAGADLATKTDLKTAIAELRTELKAEIAELRGEMRQSELRLEAWLESVKVDVLNQVFSLILGALVVNIVAIVGAVLAAVKLAGH
jgi:hypothetical protein